MSIKIKPEEIVTLEDGYKYYWPYGFNGGCFSPEHLRSIANQLDNLNKDWDKVVSDHVV